ncbi:ABC-F family ATP-binding cassette domain-containing protein [Sinimarinibacterium flocculans]|uniref:ABC-F family ATP-binding cassette domain-containing protein n=1 Tax=Sinimarinibacterium flocculans TaxID=985250 RepID=UPI0035173E30
MSTLRDVTLRRGVKVVLQGASVTLNPGEKIGLVGRNGAGKSSLFLALSGRLETDAGEVEVPSHWRVGEVEQHMPETEQAATDFVLEGDRVLMAAHAALAAAEAAQDGHAMAEAHAALAQAGSFDARSRAQTLLMGLGFTVGQLDSPVNSFSGGWRMRLQLARALMCPAELLLLDEPTNHLDLDALVWLEAWLQRHPATLLVISHDREFLDAVTKVTLHLEDARLSRYGGHYTAFESMRAERLLQQQAAFDRQQDRMAQLQRFIDRFKAKASKAKQAQSRVKALARMEKLAPVLTASDFSFDFREPASVPNPMISLRDLHCGYGQQVVVRGVQRSVLAGQRIGILGANGQGKSTFIKTLVGEIAALGGTKVEGKGLAIGYFAQQEMDLLQDDDTPLQVLVRWARERGPDAREQELRDFLGQFRFTGDQVLQAVGTLSGGERARLVLAMIVWQRPNLLVLDEPTNHLDPQTREALSLAHTGFEGSVLLVSHDRALLREVCDEFWLVAGGTLQPFDGDLDDYQRWLAEEHRARSAQRLSKEAPSHTPVAASGGPQAPSHRREDRKAAAAARQEMAQRTRPLKQELQRIEDRLAAIVEQRAALEARVLQGSAAGGLSAADRAETGRTLHGLQEEEAALEHRWLELGQTLQELQAQDATP